MPVRQMKLRFDAKPTARIVPSQLRSATPRGGATGGNKKVSGKAAPLLGVAGLPPPVAAAAGKPPAAGA